MILPRDLKLSENVLHGLQHSPHFTLLPLVSQCNIHCSVVSPWLGSAIRTTGLSRWFNVKEFTCQCRTCKTCRFDPWGGKKPWGRQWQPTLIFLHGKSHGWISLVGYSLWGHKESDTEHAHTRRITCFLPKLILTPVLKVSCFNSKIGNFPTEANRWKKIIS